METDIQYNKHVGLIAVVAAITLAAALYAWLLPIRWVTPDEGAHMMSAWRIHNGEIPLVDYESRPPLYTYIHSLSQLFFGNTLFAGRIVSLVSTLLVGYLIFLIGRMIQGDTVGIVAAILFLFSPLTIEYATIVQTQPVVLVFSCAAVLSLLSGGRWQLVISGVLMACAYYVRQSSIAIAVAALIWVFFMRGGGRALLRQGLPVMAGFCSVVFAMVLYYLQWLSPSEIWQSNINPLRIGLDAITKFVQSPPHGSDIVSIPQGVIENSAKAKDKTLGRPASLSNLLLGAQFICFILIAAAGTMILKLRVRENNDDEAKFWFLLFWLACLFLVYVYWFIARGFFPGYLREFEPGLAILAATGITRAVYKIGIKRVLVFLLPILIIVLIPLPIVTGKLPIWVEGFTLAVCSGFAVIILLCAGRVPVKKAVLPLTAMCIVLGLLFTLRRVGNPLADLEFVGLLLTSLILVVTCGIILRWSTVDNYGSRLLLGATAFGLTMSLVGVAQRGGLDFQAPWPVPVVTSVAELIEKNTGPNDEIMSGGVVWSYLADRYPYMKQNHPLGFHKIGKDSKGASDFYRYYLENPPAIVVLDGWTEKIWFKSSQLKAALEANYVQLDDVEGTDKVEVIIHKKIEIP